ncbi:MAG: hypothetical protein N2448_00175 [Caloramator sp.]|nr:hypothetical protein [Caloramator sp.]
MEKDKPTKFIIVVEEVFNTDNIELRKLTLEAILCEIIKKEIITSV